MRLLPRPTALAAVRITLVVVAAVRVARGARRSHPISGAPDHEGPCDSGTLGITDDVTVVVPARDEAGRIDACVRSLVAAGARVLVVDDGSTDGTRAVAEAAGATVTTAGALPRGWAGKAHALQVGLEIAATRIVVAVDADTRAAPDFVTATATALGDRALVTAGARVDAPHPAGRLVHASMLASLVYRFGPPGVTPRRPQRLLASGQCMVIDRAAVLDAGGFHPVAGSLTEDVALARHLADEGLAVAFEDATEVLEVVGYGDARATLDGWGRSLALREVTSVPWMLADLAVVWFAMALPLPRLLSGRGDAVDAAAVGLRLGVVAATRSAFRQRGLPLLLAPVVDVVVAARLTAGALTPDRSWRGRDYTGS